MMYGKKDELVNKIAKAKAAKRVIPAAPKGKPQLQTIPNKMAQRPKDTMPARKPVAGLSRKKDR